jgi:hypothetical protein
MKIHLLTIGVGKLHFSQAAKRLATAAKNSSMFESVIVENSSTLESNHKRFFLEHHEFLNNPHNARGYGHYLWKPYLIDHWRNHIPPNDILVYLDSGCHLNLISPKSRNRFLDYVDLAVSSGGLAMQLRNNSFGFNDLTEESWSRQDLLIRLNANAAICKGNQIQSGIVFVGKSEQSRQYTKLWWDLAKEENHLFLDDERIKDCESTLIESRWEQSIHSVLFKQFNFAYIPDETVFGNKWPCNWVVDGVDFPIWAMRHRSGADPFKFRLRDSHKKVVARYKL